MLVEWAKRAGRPAALAFLALALAWHPAGGRDALFQLYQRLHPRPHAAGRPAVVDVDAASLAEIGPWPWPRPVLAALVDNLNQAGAARILPDAAVAEPDGVLYAALFEPDSFISARDVVDGTFDPERVAGRLVLVGSSALGERRATALQPNVPALELHAQWIETGGRGLDRPAWVAWAEAATALAAGLVLVALVPLLGAGWGLGLAALLATAMVAASWRAFVGAQLLVDPLFPLLTSLVVWALASGRDDARHHQQGEAEHGDAVEQAAPGAQALVPGQIAAQAQQQRQVQDA